MTTLVLSIVALVCAAIPAVIFARNFGAYRMPKCGAAPHPDPLPRGGEGIASNVPSLLVGEGQDEGLEFSLSCRRQTQISVLIPARNEESSIRAAVESVLANRDVKVEVIVGDDHSSDRTAAIARDAGAAVISIPDLPGGWCGKQHACWVLAGAATSPVLVFMDADVRLAPVALARIAAFIDESGADLASGIPRQETGSFLERLLLPLIHFVLLGFLPIRRMRRRTSPAYAAGCGQLFIARRDAYEKSGGHAAIRATRHDGIKLPRLFRARGLKTDLFDATTVATCRMYHNAREVWRGLAKNATEGLGAPAAIVPATVMLVCGQILPWVIFVAAQGRAAQVAGVAILLSLAVRMAAAGRYRQSWASAWLHPLGVLVLLAIQWYALARERFGKPAEWKGRAYAIEPKVVTRPA